jgi:hypothetical protein
MPYPVYMKVQQRRREKEKEKMEEVSAQNFGLSLGVVVVVHHVP